MPDYIKPYPEVSHYFKLAQVIKGKCVIVLNGAPFILVPGDICIIRYGTQNYESYYKKDLDYEIVWFIHSPAYKLIIMDSKYKENRYKLISAIKMKAMQASITLLDEMFDCADFNDDFEKKKEILCKWLNYIKKMIYKNRYIKEESSEEKLLDSKIKAQRIEKSIEYIGKHFKENITLKAIASQSGLTESYFSTIFRKVYDARLFEYISRLRLREAAYILRTTGLNIGEVASKVGYNDIYFFSRIFKTYMGYSPKEYRKKNYNNKLTLIPYPKYKSKN